jgi:hypothetical protein
VVKEERDWEKEGLSATERFESLNDSNVLAK